MLINDYIGLGPPQATIGDVVVVFFGSHLPFVPRPVGAGQYRIIREAYVHNAMDGQLMDGEFITETFEIW